MVNLAFLYFGQNITLLDSPNLGHETKLRLFYSAVCGETKSTSLFTGRGKFLSVDGLLDDLLLSHLQKRLYCRNRAKPRFCCQPFAGNDEFLSLPKFSSPQICHHYSHPSCLPMALAQPPLLLGIEKTELFLLSSYTKHANRNPLQEKNNLHKNHTHKKIGTPRRDESIQLL